MIQSIDDVKFYIARQTSAYHFFEDCALLDVARKNHYEVIELNATPYSTDRVRCPLCHQRLKVEMYV